MDEMSGAIKLLKANIVSHYEKLDAYAIWFFLATLGCWSVNVGWMQLLAVVMVWFFLFTEVFRGQVFNRSFGQRVDELRSNIENSDLMETHKNQLVGQLCRMTEDYLPWKKIILRNYRFCVSSIFFAISTVHFWLF